MNSMSGSTYAVVCRSKYGASQKFAEMIAKKLQAALYHADDGSLGQSLRAHDTIIWLGGIYAGSINGMNILRKHMDSFKGKRVIVISVGNTPADREDILTKVRKTSIPRKYHDRIEFDHFVARANFSALTVRDRFMFTFRRLAVNLKPSSLRTEGESRFLTEYGKDLQVIDEQWVTNFVKGLNQEKG